MKLATQLHVVASEFAVPMTCKGYISALIAQGVDETPMAKLSKNISSPRKLNLPPSAYASLYAVKAIPEATTSQATATNGSVLSSMNLLPSLSMRNAEKRVPRALTEARGMLRRRALSSGE